MDRENIARLKNCLNRRCRATSSDGRQFLGQFVCVDTERNVVINNAEERAHGRCRFVGLVMIPGAHLCRFEVEHAALLDPASPPTDHASMYL
ncbi:hypothetical protein THASP1DRAFT_30233 [Thamnocephalis sphaerospora]|uniref:Sm domain-containing protein n=1 Tax=Thamnocephalis sphaerospora TaxID=78915 RepID=A0A4P9XPN1_9FUNG|nr:hypothetical protein THASP1DRAFT_30233 [Thamnocephalis sphaerospora]|eukprot:RKP07956.1 hypothetical protein THASP1DRAFT_30233 [Thamnocephalis sphaerospora]